MDKSAEETELDSLETPLEYAIRRSLLSKSKLAMIVKGADGVTQYCCVECPSKYYEKEKLELHLCMHTKQYRFLCGICGTGLKRKEHLERHTLEHQEVRPHICPECGKGFKRKEHLNIHKSTHSGEKNQVCMLCGRSFSRKDHLQKHLQTHSKLFIEQNTFPTKEDLTMDIKQEYEEDVDVKPDFSNFPMNVLDPEILMEVQETREAQEDQRNQLSIMGMTVTVPDNESRPFICYVCNKSYKRKDHLKMHTLSHIKKDKVCSMCGKSFHKEEQLQSHMSVHLQPYQPDNVDDPLLLEISDNKKTHEDSSVTLSNKQSKLKTENRPHECHVCHRKFKRKQHLKVHWNVHKKQQPTVYCSICKQAFTSNFHFNTHKCTLNDKINETSDEDKVQDIKVEEKKENKYPQQFVEVVEDPVYSAGPSLEMAGQECDIPVPLRVFVCKYCSKPFKRKDHYRIHLHIHTGIKSFFCTVCGKGFYRKDHLQKHTFVHKPKPAKPKKELPDLYPINMLPRNAITQDLKNESDIKPVITIHAPSNAKLRVPLQIKVPYQVVTSNDKGEKQAITIDPQSGSKSLS